MLGRVKPPAWYVNAAWRTAQALVPALARPDDAFAATWLPPAELALYQRMDRRDRDHACRVARAVLALAPDADGVLVRAALLHDVGKADAPYRAWERIAVHVHTPPEEATERWYGRPLAAAWRRHRSHAERGAAMVLEAGGDPRVAELVRCHHDTAGPDGLALLQRVDSRT